MKFTMREARAGHGPGLHCQSRREWRLMSGVQAGHMMMMVLSLVCSPHHPCPDIRVGVSGPRQQVREREWCDIRADPGLDIWSLVSRGRSEILIPLQGRSHTIVIYIQALIWDIRRAGAWKCIGESMFTWILQCELTLKWVWTQRIRRLQWLTLLCPDTEGSPQVQVCVTQRRNVILLLPQWTET